VNEAWTETAIVERTARRVWRTAAGEEIPYEKLGNEHLLKILAHLRRSAVIERGRSLAALCMYRPGGDGASDACESAMDGFLEETAGGDKEAEEAWRRFARPEFGPLEALARERGLDVTFLRSGSHDMLVATEISEVAIAVKSRDLAQARDLISRHEKDCADLAQARALIAKHEKGCPS
jgi:hypothetical protein